MFHKTLKTNLSITLLFATFTIFLLFSCKKERMAKKMPPSVSSYLYAYTSGTISKAANIRLRFTKSVINSELIGNALENGVLQFAPDIKGVAHWEDDRTVIFEPAEWMESKTTYVAKVQLKKLFSDVPKEANSFEFDFRTKDQFMDLTVAGLEAEDPSDLKIQRLKGTLYTSDLAEAEKIENILTAKQNGQKLDIKWEHDENGLDHNFYVENVIRTAKESKVELTWNSKSIGLRKKGSQDVSIPSINVFKLMNAQIVQGKEQFIALNFSDPLRMSQNLDGLIKIQGFNGSMKYIIDGNQIRVYPSKRLTGEKEITIQSSVKNSANAKMGNKAFWKLQFEALKPQVRLVGTGTVMPESEGLIFPFEAVGLNSVDIEIFKIFDGNILQFLQTNQLEGQRQLERVGKVLMQKKFDLSDLNPEASLSNWSRYAIDLKPLIEKDPNAIYQVRIGFRQNYTNYNCGKEETANSEDLTVVEAAVGSDGEIKSIWNESYRYYDGYRYSHRKDPCFKAYYRPQNFVRQNVLASNIGLIAKRGKDGSLFVATTDLRTTEPIPNVQLDFYDYAQQLIETVYADGDGTANILLKKKPFVLVATNNAQKGYLRLLDPSSLSLSRFDVSGVQNQKGLKGYIYGERGVWRPGDSLYLNFVLEDKLGKLPTNHPINFELYDARGQLQQKFTSSENVSNIYPLTVSTSSDSPTGNWRAVVKAGGATFSKNLKIETIKPNRLKVNLDFGKETLSVADKNLEGNLQVNWLHGAPAQNLAAKVEVQVKSVKTKFNKFKEYIFDDPARSFSAEPQVIFDGKVDPSGSAKVKAAINVSNAAPGKLRAQFKSRAFEQSGDFSIDNFGMEYHPFESYTGIFLPKNSYNQKRFGIGKEGKIEVVAVDKEGNPLKGRKLKMGVYRVNWRWWWDRNNGSEESKYNTSTHYGALEKAEITTNSKGEGVWRDYFYSGYPWNDGKGQNREAAAMLNFTSNKDVYNVGETVELKVPATENGRCLISIESGSRVIESYWKDAKAGENKFQFYATKEMSPNVYAYVTLIQAHGQAKNDLPMRMYGVIPIKVEDPKTKLAPVLKMAEVLAPEEKVKIQVTEKDGNAMAYTIDLVDDGLLDLTRFKTPNPWNSFYAREALGVKTWDLYNQVLGAYGGELERVLSIGGDGEVNPANAKKNANRFKPVVKHLGPFFLKKGGKDIHEITIPNYVGSVRTMVVASNNGAYGSAEKTTPVRKPLMILATLPRVLGPTETLRLPVNVFAMEDKVKNVTVTVEEQSGLVDVLGGSSRSISFAKPGDDMVFFDLQVKENIGVAKFKITAEGAGERAYQEIEIEVRNPNPRVTEVLDKTLDPNGIWSENFEALGMYGTNEGILELSNIPPLNLGRRMEYLLRYPHGCIEQTTSSGFPQLYVDRLLELDESQKRRVSDNIKATIKRIKQFQIGSGRFSYWPGGNYASDWGTNYAGHFLLEAQKLGYNLPPNLIDRWKKAQAKTARNWRQAQPIYLGPR